MTRARSERGFTLIELLVVIAIIGIIVTVAVGQYQKSIQKAREATLRQDLYVMRTAINQYFADKGRYPSDLQTLVSDSYLYKIPHDPISGSDSSWMEIEAQMTDEDISQEPGIIDVKSGADGIGLDGSSYQDW